MHLSSLVLDGLDGSVPCSWILFSALVTQPFRRVEFSVQVQFLYENTIWLVPNLIEHSNWFSGFWHLEQGAGLVWVPLDGFQTYANGSRTYALDFQTYANGWQTYASSFQTYANSFEPYANGFQTI